MALTKVTLIDPLNGFKTSMDISAVLLEVCAWCPYPGVLFKKKGLSNCLSCQCRMFSQFARQDCISCIQEGKKYGRGPLSPQNATRSRLISFCDSFLLLRSWSRPAAARLLPIFFHDWPDIFSATAAAAAKCNQPCKHVTYDPLWSWYSE